MGDWIWAVIPVTALAIPIVAIFSSHQQKMAKIIHGGGDKAEVEALRAEISDLRRQLGQQALALEDLRSTVRSLGIRTDSGTLSERLTS